ncbi:uncharacterized protein LOC119610582, partial [Lucilia sericata]|uniref:uncharacterized protein LOC119610582 n=1 Tax=Lucilia sericata TaxID=13632 RepID=UPI0018A82F16
MASSIEENNIYVTLLSNDSVHIYNNSPSTFTNLLKQSLNLNGEWIRNISNLDKSSKHEVTTISKLSTYEHDNIKSKFKELMDSSNGKETNLSINNTTNNTPQTNVSLKEKVNKSLNKVNVERNAQVITKESGSDKKDLNQELENDRNDSILSTTHNILENSLNKFSSNISHYWNKVDSTDVTEI